MTTLGLVSKLGLGTVQFGLDYGISNSLGRTPAGEVKPLLSYAAGAGVDLLDTAGAYGCSEEVLGQNDLSAFKIVSKFIVKDRNNLETLLKADLERLHCSSLFAYLAHRPQQIIEHPHYWEQLQELKAAGYIQKVGFSFDTPAEAEAVLQAGLLPDLVQLPFNYLDHRFEPLMKSLHQRGCEIHARSPFLQGLFFADLSSLPSFFEGIRTLLENLQQYGPGLKGSLLKYCAELPYIDKVIFGVNSLDQLVENINSFMAAEALPPLNSEVDENIVIPSKWPT